MDQQPQIAPPQTAPESILPPAEPAPKSNKTRNILLVIVGLIVLATIVFGVMQLIQNAAPHRKTSGDSSKQAQSFTGTGVSVAPTDSKGTWVKLAQDWRAPLTTGAQVNYAVASDSTRAYVSVSSFSNAKSELRAYDGATGKLDWDVVFPSDVQTYGKPIAGNGIVVQSTNKGELIGYDGATGKELWRKTAGPFTDRLETYGAFLDGTFYYTYTKDSLSKDTIYGVDARSGETLYSHSTSAWVGLQNLRVAGDYLVIGSQDGSVGAFSKDLKVVWQHSFTSSDKPGKTYAFGDTVIAAQLVDNAKDTTKLWALDATTGKQLWSRTVTGQYAIAPVVAEGTLVLVGPVPAWKLYGYDLATGSQKWVSAGIGSDDLGRDALGVADGTLFSGNHDIEITDPTDGTSLFHKTMNYGSSNAPVSAGGHIIAVFADGVYGFN